MRSSIGASMLGASCSLKPTRCQRPTLVPLGSSKRSTKKNERVYRMTCPGKRKLTSRCDVGAVATTSSRHPLCGMQAISRPSPNRSEEHTSELQSRLHLVCRLLLEKKTQLRCRGLCA